MTRDAGEERGCRTGAWATQHDLRYDTSPSMAQNSLRHDTIPSMRIRETARRGDSTTTTRRTTHRNDSPAVRGLDNHTKRAPSKDLDGFRKDNVLERDEPQAVRLFLVPAHDVQSRQGRYSHVTATRRLERGTDHCIHQ
eukprot:3611712-Rhodomonas_salina.4